MDSSYKCRTVARSTEESSRSERGPRGVRPGKQTADTMQDSEFSADLQVLNRWPLSVMAWMQNTPSKAHAFRGETFRR